MSSITKEKHLAVALPLTAGGDNKWGETILLDGFAEQRTLARTVYPFFLHGVFSGLVPPFSEFLTVVLDHYQVHTMHLQPNCILLLSIFAFYCEVFVGMRPSVALLHHFFYLRMHDATQRSGCVSFAAVHKGNILMRVRKKQENFQRRWVFMDAKGLNV